jgi:LuxR family maltose regulon positive regulatory protein
LSLRDAADIPAFIDAFAGSNRFVIDYLIEEVLHRAPPHVREFLSRTAILDRLSGPLCDAVTGQSDGGEMLQSLERANLFIVPLDDRREWYRYHHLFADVLRARLLADGPDRVAALHRRASEWFERNDVPVEAIKHAFQASDFPRAARLIEAIIPGVRKSRQDATVLGWIARLPDATIQRRPVLSVFSAWSSIVTGDIAAVERHLANAERLLEARSDAEAPAHDSEPGEELDALPVTIALYRASVALATGDLSGVARSAQHAFDVARPDDHLGRGAAAGLLGLAAWAGGDLDAGVAAFATSAKSLRLAGNLTDALLTTMVVGDMLLPLGRLRETRKLYEEALHEAVEHGSGGQPTADLHAGISEMLVERNDLASAKQHLEASEALGEGAFSHEHRYRWFVSMAKVSEAEGHPELAIGWLTDAEESYRRGFFPEVRPIAAIRALVWIRQGRFSEAQAWVRQQGLSSRDELTYLREFGHITLARLLIAQHRVDPVGGFLGEAQGLLARLLVAAEAGSRMGSVNEILVLQALALQAEALQAEEEGDVHGHAEASGRRQKQTSLALVPLGRALAQAEPEGYVRLFVDEGAPMLALLRAAAGVGISADYVRRLSQVMRQAEGAMPTSQPVEPLSDRELHVLRLLATELTGPQIARELHVSLNTMRTHTKHIFVKLEVSSRAAAVRRAESLGLI